MAELPSGTVTFLFTDIERSTQSAEELGDERWADVLERHRQLLRPVFSEHGGAEVGTEGDAFFVAFGRAGDAVTAAIKAQRALERESEVSVRVGMHTGEALVRGNDYIGHDVHKAKRISDAGHGGQILLSRTTADLVASSFTLKDLGPHRLKDLGEPQQVFQVEAEGLRTNFPALRTLDTARHNLPVQLTSFVGRERELAEVRSLLEKTRLLTITGAGGCGKTRLALQLGAEVATEVSKSVWLVDLAPRTDPSTVLHAVAEAVRLPQGHGDDDVGVLTSLEDRLIAHLRDRAVLIILDNCEHLIGACAHLTTLLLQSCPDLQVVVTTREPLGIAGETSWRLPSLDVPDRVAPEGLADAEATRLFIERATQTLPSFFPDPEDAKAIVDICTRLDGIPLAIELAAARVRVLPCPQIAKRLDDRFRLLTGGSRTAMPRQQTLRATVDWSHDLLSDPQKALLRRLSVFAGGFSLEAAEAVCADELVLAIDVLDHVTSLVDRSLVMAVQTERRGRYKLLDTVRHYAREKLLDSGEGPGFRRRHMDHFVALAERSGAGVIGPNVRAWLDVLNEEFENLRQAFEWALEEDPEAALRVVGWLREFFGMSIRTTEARRWATAALESAPDAPVGDRIGGMRTATMGLPGELLEQALDLARAHGETAHVAAILEWRGRGRSALGHTSGVADATEALALAEEIGDDLTIARAHRTLAVAAAMEGDVEGQRAHLQLAVEVARRAGDLHSEAITHGTLGQVARLSREYTEAQKHFERQLELVTELGCRNCLALCQLTLGWLARGSHSYDEAIDYSRRTVRLAYEDRMEFILYFALGTLAMVAHDLGDNERAATVLGIADARRASIGITAGGDQAQAEQRRIAQVRDVLGEEAFDASFAAGQEMHYDDAIAYALETSGP